MVIWGRSDPSVVQTLARVVRRTAAGLKPLGFKASGQVFRRDCGDGILHVADLQRVPPSAGKLPEMKDLDRANDRFAVNLGIHLTPEASWLASGPPPGKPVHEYHAPIRARVHGPEGEYWSLRDEPESRVPDLLRGLAVLEGLRTRAAIEALLEAGAPGFWVSPGPELVLAALRKGRGDSAGASAWVRKYLARPGHRPGHRDSVKAMAARMGLDGVEGPA